MQADQRLFASLPQAFNKLFIVKQDVSTQSFHFRNLIEIKSYL